ncbi:protein kinase, partial [Myxococcota bacterium]|nr:protein kinase [Myxococcota bacterium]
MGCEVNAGAPNPDLPVVIVWMPDDVAKDAKQIARAQRETAFVTQLKHPNILRVHGLEHFEEGWARVVAFIDGEPLFRLVTRARELGRAIDPRIAGRIVLDACEGVHHAHEEGQARYAGRPIVHGGLRPDTLFVGFSGVTLVTGFGASTVMPTQQGGSLREKYAYLAPEQIIGGKATASTATDIYALGAILYELLTGKAPFVDAADVERAVLTGEPPVVDEPGLAGRLGNIAATALSKRGTDRFESAAAMRDAILAAFGAETPATPEEVAALVSELVPVDAAERAQVRSMLESANDPESVTVLSRPPRPERGDSGVHAAPRAGSVSSVALDPAEFAPSRAPSEVESRVRPARPREEKTIIDGRPPQQLSIHGPMGDEETATGDRPSQTPMTTGPIPTIAVADDMPTDASVNPMTVAAVRAEIMVADERRELASLQSFDLPPASAAASEPRAAKSERPVPVAPSLRDPVSPVLALQEGLVTDPATPALSPLTRDADATPAAIRPQAVTLSSASSPASSGPAIPPFTAPPGTAAGVLG